MGRNLFQKICDAHNLDHSQKELPIIPDQVLNHDGTATPVYLQLEAIGIPRIKPFTVTYIDHNTLQVGFRNPDDHLYMKGMAAKLGSIISKAGNGICHQVHLEDFARPGQILVGADSHTPMAGGVGMLGIGAGGLDVAAVMAGEPFYVPTPKVVGVRLEGELPPWSAGKDVILHLLKTVSVKGGVGKIFEFFGRAVSALSVYDRATICNMGAETGATSSLFPSDETTHRFLACFGREAVFRNLEADADAEYDETIIIDLSLIEPLIALPHSPDHVNKVSEVEGTPLNQVGIGSCTNSSYNDLAMAAFILDGKRIHNQTDLVISAGSWKTLSKIAETGDLSTLIKAGARILENTCGPCNGVGQSPHSGANSLRTYNRNYRGRSGTLDANIYLASAETAAASALAGCITDPRKLGRCPEISLPTSFPNNAYMFIPPPENPDRVTVVKGPNIKPMPLGSPVEDRLKYTVALKAGDNITTDHILPGGADLLALRSNIPASVPYVFNRIDPDFADRIDTLPESWAVVGGENYGQGSSREHAVMVPMSVGMRLVMAKSFARIYRRNLINYGVIPLTFKDPEDYDRVRDNDILFIQGLEEQIQGGVIIVINKTKDISFATTCNISHREKEVLIKGGLLNNLRMKRGSNGSGL
jgi:aconitate hydratase